MAQQFESFQLERLPKPKGKSMKKEYKLGDLKKRQGKIKVDSEARVSASRPQTVNRLYKGEVPEMRSFHEWQNLRASYKLRWIGLWLKLISSLPILPLG